MISTIIGCFLLTFTQSIGVFYAISLLIGITNAGTEYFESLTCLIMSNNVIDEQEVFSTPLASLCDQL